MSSRFPHPIDDAPPPPNAAVARCVCVRVCVCVGGGGRTSRGPRSHRRAAPSHLARRRAQHRTRQASPRGWWRCCSRHWEGRRKDRHRRRSAPAPTPPRANAAAAAAAAPHRVRSFMSRGAHTFRGRPRHQSAHRYQTGRIVRGGAVRARARARTSPPAYVSPSPDAHAAAAADTQANSSTETTARAPRAAPPPRRLCGTPRPPRTAAPCDRRHADAIASESGGSVCVTRYLTGRRATHSNNTAPRAHARGLQSLREFAAHLWGGGGGARRRRRGRPRAGPVRRRAQLLRRGRCTEHVRRTPRRGG
jgi:hypothetical protein